MVTGGAGEPVVEDRAEDAEEAGRLAVAEVAEVGGVPDMMFEGHVLTTRTGEDALLVEKGSESAARRVWEKKKIGAETSPRIEPGPFFSDRLFPLDEKSLSL